MSAGSRRLERIQSGAAGAAVRRATGFSQDTIAAALGVTRAAVSGWETGRNLPPAAYKRVIAGLARHLEVTW